MRLIAGPLNNELLVNLLHEAMPGCIKVRAAVAYANRDNMLLFEECLGSRKPLEFYGRYDHTVAVSPDILKWFLAKASPNLQCHLVPDILHAKVIWWVETGAYIGSANLSDRAWYSNIEAGMFVPHDELVETGLENELLKFFDKIDDHSFPLRKEIYEEQLRLSDQRALIGKSEVVAERNFGTTRLLPKNNGISAVVEARGATKRMQKFEHDWNETLQIMRDIAQRVSQPDIRPEWIDESVPPGVQADQFLHAYYYKQVREGNRHPYEEFHERNAHNPESALLVALDWWRKGDFDHEFEERTIYDWAPQLRAALARGRLLTLSKVDFVHMASMVHAIRDHAVKQENEHLGLPDSPQASDDKVEKFGEWLWSQRAKGGKSVLDVIYYVVWGTGNVAPRLWNAYRSEEWKISHFGLSSLGEIIGWARPDEFPPRNMRTSKGLRALGYKVQIGI